MQGLTLADINASQKYFNARFDVKLRQSHLSVKSRSRAPGCRAYLKSMSKTITMQAMALAAITASLKRT